MNPKSKDTTKKYSNKTYLEKALTTVDFLKTKRKKNTAYMHGAKYTATTSLKDNLAMLKTLMLVYRATQRQAYKTEAEQLIKDDAIKHSALFNSEKK